MTNSADAPGAWGFRMPAEWEPHEATWVSWPHKEASWPGKLTAIRPVFAQLIACLSRSETVHVNVNDAQAEAAARRDLAEFGPLGKIVFHHFPTNDAWCRDHGAIVLTRPSGWTSAADDPFGHASRLAVDWRYNAWGGKYPPYDLDDAIPPQMARILGIPCLRREIVLEGGSIDVNGNGVLLTTESCLLNPNRNPELSRSRLETVLRDNLGVEKILWLGDGIVGDDTDGHIDDITRFVAEGTVVTAVESDPADENYEPLQANLERLQGMTTRTDQPLKVIELPMPRPVIYDETRLPASYANFYIANSMVLVPCYGGPADGQAQDILATAFPNREMIGIDCTDLVWGLGAFHCLTQQIPA